MYSYTNIVEQFLAAGDKKCLSDSLLLCSFKQLVWLLNSFS